MRRYWALPLLAAVALGCQGSSEAIVADAIDSASPDRQREAVAELSSHGWGLKEPYLKAYSLIARENDPGVRCAAINALGRSGEAGYVPDVLRGLSDPAPAVRVEAVVALGRLGAAEAVEPLCRQVLTDNDAGVRLACVRVLEAHRTRPVLTALLGALRDEEFSVRFAARRALAGMTGIDAGYESDHWLRRLAAREDPFERARTESSSPWYWPF